MPLHPHALWKKPGDVDRVTFFERRDQVIGEASYGTVVRGRLHFKRETGEKSRPKRVAVKLFHNSLSDADAHVYQTCIRDLANAGVRLPKMGLIKTKTQRSPQGEWVQVSQLFGSTKRRKIRRKSYLNLQSIEEKREAIVEFTKIANAGYSPRSDVVEPFISPLSDGKRAIIPIDIDRIIAYGKRSLRDQSEDLQRLIFYMSKTTTRF
jgi:hypothetical protein